MLVFRLIREENGVFLYQYSRECQDYDGIISIDSRTNEITIVKQSKSDEDEIDVRNTVDMAEALIKDNYPAKRTVMFY